MRDEEGARSRSRVGLRSEALTDVYTRGGIADTGCKQAKSERGNRLAVSPGTG